MRKRGAEESLSFLMGVVVAIIIAIPMFILIWNYVEAQNMSEKNFEELVKVVKEMKVGEERDFAFLIKENSFLASFNKDQEILKRGYIVIGECKLSDDLFFTFRSTLNRGGTCGENNCLCLCNIKTGLSSENFENACSNKARCKSFEDLKIFGKCFDTKNIFVPGVAGKNNLLTLHIEKKEIGGEVVVGICLEKPCIK